MRHGTSNRRQRNRGGSGRRSGGQNNRSQVFDSNGPDVRIRGTAHQVAEKYMSLAKDAAASDDTMMEQNYLQHAEHYQRIINSWDSSDVQSSRQRESADQSQDEDQERKGDLSLPSSILGGNPNSSSDEKKERTPEMSA